MGWWSSRLSRPALFEVQSKNYLDQISQHEPVFAIAVPDTDTDKVIQAWTKIALGFMDRYTFAIISDLMVAREVKMTTVKVYSPDYFKLDPLHYDGALSDHDALLAWVQHSRHPAL